jgi:hypothetical protein
MTALRIDPVTAAEPVGNAGCLGSEGPGTEDSDAIRDHRRRSRWSEKIDGAARRAPSPLLAGPHVKRGDGDDRHARTDARQVAVLLRV